MTDKQSLIRKLDSLQFDYDHINDEVGYLLRKVEEFRSRGYEIKLEVEDNLRELEKIDPDAHYEVWI